MVRQERFGERGARKPEIRCVLQRELDFKNFDIMAEGGSNPVVKTFDNIQPTAQGRIVLSFMPVVNYPEVNAIEVVAEPRTDRAKPRD